MTSLEMLLIFAGYFIGFFAFVFVASRYTALEYQGDDGPSNAVLSFLLWWLVAPILLVTIPAHFIAKK